MQIEIVDKCEGHNAVHHHRDHLSFNFTLVVSINHFPLPPTSTFSQSRLFLIIFGSQNRKRVSQIDVLILRQVERVMIRGMEIHHLLVVVVSVLLSLVLQGEGGITSSYVRSEWPAVDIPLDHKVFKVPKGYNAPQQVSPLTHCFSFI